MRLLPRMALMALLAVGTVASGALAEDQTLTPGPRLVEEAATRSTPTNTEPTDARTYLDAARFRALFEGKTIHLTADNLYYGSEYYIPGDRSVWVFNGGGCQNGKWVYTAAQEFCFTYGSEVPSCWRVFESGGNYYAEAFDGLLLRVAEISNEPLSCEPELLS